MLKKISTIDAVFIVLMATCGLVLKPIIGPLTKLIGSALFLSSGSFAGMIYYIFPMLALLVVRQFGSATLTGLIQGIIILVTGIYGSHGILSLITYVVPCLFIDLAYVTIRKSNREWLIFFPGAMGNLSGNFIVAVLFLHLPMIPLIITLIISFVFGGVSGYISLNMYKWLINMFPILNKSV
ncbi:ECF transporter S component [candidate division KSB1 bacterium]|nr:ECF transporter S component [candidate division KSB1 bacterium]MBL7095731.1 ECF transporter S component [candidate division KSB1 bacterium]